MTNKKDETARISLSLPKTILDEINSICSACFVSRSHWFLQASIEKLKNDKIEKSKILVKRLEDLENR